MRVGAILAIFLAALLGLLGLASSSVGAPRSEQQGTPLSDCPIVPRARLAAIVGDLHLPGSYDYTVSKEKGMTDYSCVASSDQGVFDLVALCTSPKRAGEWYSYWWRYAQRERRAKRATRPRPVGGLARKAFHYVSDIHGHRGRFVFLLTPRAAFRLGGRYSVAASDTGTASKIKESPLGLMLSLARAAAPFRCRH